MVCEAINSVKSGNERNGLSCAMRSINSDWWFHLSCIATHCSNLL